MFHIIGSRKPKIYLALGIYDHWKFRSQESIVKLQQEQRLWETGSGKEIYGESNLTRLRNTFALDFLNNTNDDFMFLFDADIVCFTPSAIDLLVSDDKPIVGAPYIFKTAPFKPAFVTFDNRYDLRERKISFEVKFVSGGFMLISREVIKKIVSKYPVDPIQSYLSKDGKEHISEDWSISDRAREFNLKTFLNPNINLGHIGDYPYTMRDYYAFYIDRIKP